MIYRAIGVMSGSSLDGLDICFTEFEESRGVWSYSVKAADCFSYDASLKDELKQATNLTAKDYLLLHTRYGKYIGEQINRFIEKNNLYHQIQLIASHGHTTFHIPQQQMTAQLGDGAAIAAITGINVVSDLRNMDVALGGQGAPIVPMGERLLWNDYALCLNIGGIANISLKKDEELIAFDICPANRVLNLLAERIGKEYDENGEAASKGSIHTPLLTALNQLEYYKKPAPKSLANEFGTEVVFSLIESFGLSAEDALRTYVEHIADQIAYAILNEGVQNSEQRKMLVTGGGAFNQFLIKTMQTRLSSLNISVDVPDADTVNYKEAIVMALLGVLRWREENTVLSSVTGAQRSSIGGAVWIGQEA